MKHIELVIKSIVAIFLIWGTTEIVITLKGYKADRYSYHSGKVLDKQTGKIYSVVYNKLMFDPAKAK